jgi:hypothetical protein
LWSVTGGTINSGINTATVSVTWGSAGTGTITVKYSEAQDATPKESSPTTVTIHDVPTIASITAPAGVCDNSALYLTDPVVTSNTIFPVITTSKGWVLDSNDFTSGSTVTHGQTGTNLYYQADNACGHQESNTVQITVYPLPVVTIVSSLPNPCPGESLDLKDAINNPFGYDLSFHTALTGGGVVPNPNAQSLTGTMTYYVQATDGNNCVSSPRLPFTINRKTVTAISGVTLDIPNPTEPGVVGDGNSFSLSVAAVGENLRDYQWSKDGIDISGAQSDTYNVPAASHAAHYGIYYVKVSGDCGDAQSSPVTVNILSPDATLSGILVNNAPVPGFHPQTTDYIYTVHCDVDLANIIGTPTSSVASVTPSSLTNQSLVTGDNIYTLTVTAENGIATKTYRINVIRDCYIPKITKDLEDAIICQGESHTFEILAEGENLTYEWYYGNNRILGANTNRYTINTSGLQDYERYYVIVRSSYGDYRASTYSKKARLWVAEPLPEKLRFAVYPDPAITGQTHHIKLAGYADVTQYVWSYDREGVTFSPEVGLGGENETWATFGTLSVGSGTIKATLTHPCGTREATRTITVKYPAGTDDITADEVSVYPNPTAGTIKVNNTTANQLIRITDITGSLKGTYKSQEGTTTIDLTAYAKGTYMLQYNGKTFKIIKN